ncbi:MAG: MCP four helix bundle domain-containing protein, partial [Calditrichia bacterium]
MLNNLKLSYKFMGAFLLVTLTAVIIGIFGFSGMSGIEKSMMEISDVRLPSIQGLLMLKEAQTGLIVGERGLLLNSYRDEWQAQYDYIDDKKEDMQRAWDIYEPLPQTQEESALWNKYVPQYKTWLKKHNHFIDLSRQRDRLLSSGNTLNSPEIKELEKQMNKASLEARIELLDSWETLDNIIELNSEVANAQRQHGLNVAATNQTTLLIVLLAGVLFAFGLSFILTRIVIHPIVLIAEGAQRFSMGDYQLEGMDFKKIEKINIRNDELGDVGKAFSKLIQYQTGMASAAEDISRGNLDIDIQAASEKDTLGKSMMRLLNNINNLIKEMNRMAKEHNAGDIDYKIPVEKFQGAYHEMAAGINDMVAGHINVKKKAMACIKEFGKGNFNAELEKFPGKKAFINEVIEDVRENLKLVSREIGKLIDASEEGNLDTRGDVSGFDGDWKKMVGGINKLLDAVIEPVQEAQKVLEYASKGDLTHLVAGDYKGDHAKIKNSLNKTIESLNDILGQVTISVEQVAS